MKPRLVYFILTPCILALTAAYAQTSQPVVKLPNEIEFKAPVSAGPQTAVLYGDPTKPGVYVRRLLDFDEGGQAVIGNVKASASSLTR